MTQKHTLVIIAVLVTILSLNTVSLVLNSDKARAHVGQIFSTTLSGNNVVPPTNSNASGFAYFHNFTKGDIVSSMYGEFEDTSEHIVGVFSNVTYFDHPTGVHIHGGNEGENGPILVDFRAPGVGDPGTFEKCIRDFTGIEGTDTYTFCSMPGITRTNEIYATGDLNVTESEIADMLDTMNKGGVYIDIHTELYPDGAIRGQLKADDSINWTGLDSQYQAQ